MPPRWRVNFATRRKRVVSFTPRPPYSWHKWCNSPPNTKIGRAQTRCGRLEKNFLAPVGSQITIPKTSVRLTGNYSDWAIPARVTPAALWRNIAHCGAMQAASKHLAWKCFRWKRTHSACQFGVASGKCLCRYSQWLLFLLQSCTRAENRCDTCILSYKCHIYWLQTFQLKQKTSKKRARKEIMKGN